MMQHEFQAAVGARLYPKLLSTLTASPVLSVKVTQPIHIATSPSMNMEDVSNRTSRQDFRPKPVSGEILGCAR